MKYLIVLAVFLLCACQVKVDYGIEQQSLLQKCSTDTPLPEKYVVNDGVKQYNGKEVMRVLTEWNDIYTDCASKHNILVDTILGSKQ